MDTTGAVCPGTCVTCRYHEPRIGDVGICHGGIHGPIWDALTESCERYEQR